MTSWWMQMAILARRDTAAVAVFACLAAGCTSDLIGLPASVEVATASSLTLEELSAGVCNPVMFENRNAGFTGPGYINPPNDLAARVAWSIRTPAGGPHRIEIRYASGGDVSRNGRLGVNAQGSGDERFLDLPPTGGWTNWATATLSIDLKPGVNDLVLRASTPAGLPNIDSLTVLGADLAPGDCGRARADSAAKPVDLQALDVAPTGWATLNGGVTGGGDATPKVVTTMEELQRLAAGEHPQVIHVRGRFRGPLVMGSNKTIIGLGGAEIADPAGPLRLTGSRNVIIKNLTLIGASGSNRPNTVFHDVENIWLDHNTFVDGSPDLILFSGTSSYVTLSWNVLRHTIFAHEHAGINIGASDTAWESVGRMKVTLHHNHFAELVNERMPRVRFGQVHVFNNLADAGTDALSRSYYAIRPGVDADVRSERNVFLNFQGPSWYWTSEKLGAETATVFNFARGNAPSVLESIEDVCLPGCVVGPIAIREHEGVSGLGGFYSHGRAFTPPYAYVAEPTEGLEAKIRAGAGAR